MQAVCILISTLVTSNQELFNQDAPPDMKVASVAQRTEPDDLPDENPFNGINTDHLYSGVRRDTEKNGEVDPTIFPVVRDMQLGA
jgi:hypothetical protein